VVDAESGLAQATDGVTIEAADGGAIGDMRRLAFSIAILALSFVAATPALAFDFAVIRFRDGRCEIWWGAAAVPPWGAGWVKIAVTPDWWSAQIARDWAISNGACVL